MTVITSTILAPFIDGVDLAATSLASKLDNGLERLNVTSKNVYRLSIETLAVARYSYHEKIPPVYQEFTVQLEAKQCAFSEVSAEILEAINKAIHKVFQKSISDGMSATNRLRSLDIRFSLKFSLDRKGNSNVFLSNRLWHKV